MAATASKRPIPTGEGLTFEKVWATMQETREQTGDTVRINDPGKKIREW